MWKDIDFFEWLYQISDQGEVKSLNYRCTWKQALLRPTINNWGYLYVWLHRKWIINKITIHRLVATNFIPNPENKPEVNHKNWIKTDNRIENLEWVTKKENSRHAFETGLCANNHFRNNHYNKGRFWKEHNRSKTIIQFTKDWIFIREWWSMREVERELWIYASCISSCCLWQAKTAWKFVWKFKL